MFNYSIVCVDCFVSFAASLNIFFTLFYSHYSIYRMSINAFSSVQSTKPRAKKIKMLLYYNFDGISAVSQIKNAVNQVGVTNFGSSSISSTLFKTSGKSINFTAGGLTTEYITPTAYGLSVSVWFYPTNFNGGSTPRIYQSSLGDGQSLMYGTTTGSSVMLNQDNQVTQIDTIYLNTWQNLVITFDIPNNTTKYYLNNVLKTTVSTTAYYTAGTPFKITFGTKNASTDNYIGYMDEIKIFSGVLSSSQVANIYTTLSP